MLRSYKGIFYPLFIILFPLALTGLIQSSSYFFETLFLAHLNAESLAAGAIVGWMFGTFIVIVFGILAAINILVSHKHGAKDQAGIALVVRDGIAMAIILSVPSMLLFWNLSPFLLFLGQSPKIVALAQMYLHALCWGILPSLLSMALLDFIIGLGAARVTLILSLFSVSMTITFSYLFIFGKWGFPALGISGAGWGTALSNYLSLFLVIGFVLLNKKYRVYLNALWHFKKPSYLGELLRIGLPMGIMYCIEVGFFFALTLISGYLGSEFLAANQIALQYMGILMSLIFSIAQAITVRMGHLLGAGQVLEAKKTSDMGVLLGFLLMVIVGFFFWQMPTFFIAVDFDIQDPNNHGLVLIASQLLAVSAWFQIFESVRIILFGSLRALKDTRFTLAVSLISFWGIALPLGYLLLKKSTLGGPSLWWGMVVGAGFSVVVLFWRFRYKMKINYPGE
ncbi:MAG: MATE family efflux transporter [Legionella sp.]|nr:MAG: MATE family efflux transporter [Legionella sp.]